MIQLPPGVVDSTGLSGDDLKMVGFLVGLATVQRAECAMASCGRTTDHSHC